MIRLLRTRTSEAPQRRYAIHDVRRREIVLVRVVERPIEGRRGTSHGAAANQPSGSRAAAA